MTSVGLVDIVTSLRNVSSLCLKTLDPSLDIQVEAVKGKINEVTYQRLVEILTGVDASLKRGAAVFASGDGVSLHWGRYGVFCEIFDSHSGAPLAFPCERVR
jgi:hypothetical protein